MLFDMAAASQALEDLLDHERQMILSGKIGDFAGMSRNKEQLAARLPKVADAGALERIRHKAERNQALLAAAAQGLKTARERVGEISAGGRPLRTYGADGSAQEMGRQSKKDGINHRA